MVGALGRNRTRANTLMYISYKVANTVMYMFYKVAVQMSGLTQGPTEMNALGKSGHITQGKCGTREPPEHVVSTSHTNEGQDKHR
jgi:hypothetical protein